MLLFMAIIIAIFPWIVAGNEYFISILVFLGINSILAMGLCLLMGYAGQISLGHAAFYGIGAYSSGILTTQYSFPPAMAFFTGILFSALVAYLVGKPTLRLKGHYMAVATLGFGEIFFIAFNELSSWTGGPSGLSGIPPIRFLGETLEATAYLYLVWGFVILILIFSLNMVNSRVGRALRAVHGSQCDGRRCRPLQSPGICAQCHLCLDGRKPLCALRDVYQPRLFRFNALHHVPHDGRGRRRRNNLGRFARYSLFHLPAGISSRVGGL